MECPACRLINPDTATWCDCGFRFTHDTPQASESVIVAKGGGSLGIASRKLSRGAYRVGEILVIPRFAALPPNCIKCGLPLTEAAWMKQEFSWHPATWSPLPLVGHILELLDSKSMVVSYALCPEHHRFFRRLKWIAVTMLAVGVLVCGLGLTVPVSKLYVLWGIGITAFAVGVGDLLSVEPPEAGTN